MNRNVSIILLSLIFTSFQNQAHAQTEHEKHIHNEISAGMGIAFSTEMTGISPALHMHMIKGIRPKFGIGIGYEAILGGELHQSINALFNMKPNHLIDINIGPGVVLPSKDEAAVFLLGGELALTWPVTHYLHLGPVLDIGGSAHGIHMIVGVHCGLDL